MFSLEWNPGGLSRGSLLAGVLCQVRDRRSSKQFVELVRSRSHSIPNPAGFHGRRQ